jgi:hypothetical protein
VTLTLADRIAAFKTAYAKWPASWPYLVKESGRDVLYATWVLGNDYRNKTAYYGAYPPGYIARVLALFPTAPQSIRDRGLEARDVLHAFSGSLPPGPYVRLDINPATEPDVVGSVYDAAKLWLGRRPFRLTMADPAYSAADSERYGTPAIDRRRATAALARVTKAGGHLVWLDVCWPMHRKTEWKTVGRIAIVRSTNHRIRMATIFERAA